MLVVDPDAAEALQPGVGAFDFPAAVVASELAPIFIASLVAIVAGHDQIGAALFRPLFFIKEDHHPTRLAQKSLS